jgi:histidyl-tRNA synthetase
MQAIKKLRANGVSAELYPDKKKMGKQFDYANKRNIPFVVVAGETEIANDLLALKSMKTGEQEDVSLQTLITKMS